MTAYCRLKPVKVLPEILDSYLIDSVYDSEKIKYELYIKQKETKKLDFSYDLVELFKSKNKTFSGRVSLEICCGTGDFIASYAKSHPEISFIGVDYAKPVLYRAIKKAHQLGLKNILFYNGLADDFLLHDFKTTKFNEILMNFADPWPKKRHHKRRVLQIENFKHYFNALSVGAAFITATDIDFLHQDYLDIFNENKDLDFDIENINDVLIPPIDAYKLKSSYEQKGLAANRNIYYTKVVKKVK